MMFLFHIALALGLIALTSGVFLYGWACKVEGTCKCMGKMIGFVIMLLAAISVVCTISCGISAWRGSPMCMHGMSMQDMHDNAAMTPASDAVPAAPVVEKTKKSARH